jgi:hypothetical protein
MHPRSRRTGIAIAALVVLALPTVLVAGPLQHGAPARELALRQDMRKLWEDHITWTRLVIVSTFASLPDLGPTTDRLLRNQVDIGNAIEPFYGEASGDRLASLLRTHILGAAELLAAAKAHDAFRLESARTAWYANGDDIASFLNSLNPEWRLDEMRTMMRSHLDLTLEEAVDQLEGRYEESVADYDRVHVQILAMADMLSEGLIKQFPGKL